MLNKNIMNEPTAIQASHSLKISVGDGAVRMLYNAKVAEAPPVRPRTLAIGSFIYDLKWRGPSLCKTQNETESQSQLPIQLKPYAVKQPVEELLDNSIQKVTVHPLFRTAVIPSSFSHTTGHLFKTH